MTKGADGQVIYTEEEQNEINDFIRRGDENNMVYPVFREVFRQRLEDNGVKDVERKMKNFDRKHMADIKMAELARVAVNFDDEYERQFERVRKIKQKLDKAKKNGETRLIKEYSEEYKKEKKLLKTREYSMKHANKEYYETANKDSYTSKNHLGDAEGARRLGGQAVKGLTQAGLFALFSPHLALVYGACMAAGVGLCGIVNLFAKMKRNQRNATLESYKDTMREICKAKKIGIDEENEIIRDGEKEIKSEFEKVTPESMVVEAAALEKERRSTEDEIAPEVPEKIKDEYQMDAIKLNSFAQEKYSLDTKHTEEYNNAVNLHNDSVAKIEADKIMTDAEKSAALSKEKTGFQQRLDSLDLVYNENLDQLKAKHKVGEIIIDDRLRAEGLQQELEKKSKEIIEGTYML